MTSENLFTVAAVRKSPDGKVTEYLFNESPRIFRFGARLERDETAVESINNGIARKTPIKIELDPYHDQISRIAAPSESEAREFLKARVLLEKPSKPKTINLETINRSTFDIADYYLKNPVFALCRKTVPNYQKAKKIFDYCAKQSCALPGPYNIDPCIPFQYVIDGCYARAHKMRWIISKKFGYVAKRSSVLQTRIATPWRSRRQSGAAAAYCGGITLPRSFA